MATMRYALLAVAALVCLLQPVAAEELVFVFGRDGGWENVTSDPNYRAFDQPAYNGDFSYTSTDDLTATANPPDAPYDTVRLEFWFNKVNGDFEFGSSSTEYVSTIAFPNLVHVDGYFDILHESDLFERLELPKLEKVSGAVEFEDAYYMRMVYAPEWRLLENRDDEMYALYFNNFGELAADAVFYAPQLDVNGKVYVYDSFGYEIDAAGQYEIHLHNVFGQMELSSVTYDASYYRNTTLTLDFHGGMVEKSLYMCDTMYYGGQLHVRNLISAGQIEVDSVFDDSYTDDFDFTKPPRVDGIFFHDTVTVHLDIYFYEMWYSDMPEGNVELWISFPVLETVGGYVYIYEVFEYCEPVVASHLSLPKLRTVGEYVYLDYLYCASHVDFGSLTTVDEYLYLEYLAYESEATLRQLNFDSLKTVGEYIYVEDCYYAAIPLVFPSLETVAEYVYIGAWGYNAASTGLDFPKLKTVGEYVYIDCVDAETLHYINFDSLREVGTYFEIYGVYADDFHVNVPALRTVGTYFQIDLDDMGNEPFELTLCSLESVGTYLQVDIDNPEYLTLHLPRRLASRRLLVGTAASPSSVYYVYDDNSDPNYDDFEVEACEYTCRARLEDRGIVPPTVQRVTREERAWDKPAARSVRSARGAVGGAAHGQRQRRALAQPDLQFEDESAVARTELVTGAQMEQLQSELMESGVLAERADKKIARTEARAARAAKREASVAKREARAALKATLAAMSDEERAAERVARKAERKAERAARRSERV